MQYLEVIKPHLTDVIDSLKGKSHSPVKIVSRSLRDIDENPYEYLWGDNKEIMIKEET